MPCSQIMGPLSPQLPGSLSQQRLGICMHAARRSGRRRYARMLQEIMEGIGSRLLHPVPVKAEAKVLSTLADMRSVGSGNNRMGELAKSGPRLFRHGNWLV